MTRYCTIAFMLVVCACSSLYAQTTYKGVTLDRGKDSETNCIYIFNDNADSVRVVIQYKIGNRNTEWIDFPVPDLIPPSILDPQKIGCVDSIIIGLNLLDVKIIKEQPVRADKNPRSDNGGGKGFVQTIKSWFSKE